jgi:hypothetical protein
MEFNRYGYLVIDIPKEAIEEAADWAKNLGVLPNSFTEGAGRMTGFLGEIMVRDALPGAVIDHTYGHDLRDRHGNLLEIKSKNRRRFPTPGDEVSVADYTRQRADEYIFTSFNRCPDTLVYRKCYILGAYKFDDYRKNARFIPKGIIEGGNNRTVHASCWNMFHHELILAKDYFSNV